MELNEMVLDVTEEIQIKAPIAEVFRGVLHRLGEGFGTQQGDSLQLQLEEKPGGRWFRDRGNGVGHLWGHVQVLKAPTLLELSGPMFMSYPAINHLEVKLEEGEAGTTVRLRHRALGLLEKGHREGVSTGWKHLMESISKDFAGVDAAGRLQG